MTEPRIFRCGATLTTRPGTCRVPVAARNARCKKHALQDATHPADAPIAADLERLLAQFGHAPHRDPREVLLDMVTRAWQMVALLDQLVRTLPPADLALIGLEGEVLGVGPFTTMTAKAKRAAYVQGVLRLHGEWTDRAGRLAAATVKAGVEERLVRLAEQQSRLIADVIRQVLDDLPLKPGQREQALRDVAMHLRRLSAPEPILVGAGTGDTAHAA